MPLRKSSTSLGISSPSVTLKPHRSYDSNRLWDQRPPPTSGTPHTNLILALVNRLKNKVCRSNNSWVKLTFCKLPCNSGLPLDRVEGDKPTQQAIEALIELSQDSIDVIAWHLADILHMLTKVRSSTIALSFVINTGTETARYHGTSDHRSAPFAAVHLEGSFCHLILTMGFKIHLSIQ